MPERQRFTRIRHPLDAHYDGVEPLVRRDQERPFLITTDEGFYTIVMGIQRMANTGESLPLWHLIMGTAVLALLPPVLIVLSMQRLFVKGLIESEK